MAAEPGPMLDSAEKLITTAQKLRETADEMDDRRWKAFQAGEISEKEFRNNVVRGTFLRNQLSEILLEATKSVIQGIQQDQSELETAMANAKKTIKTINDVKKALTVFATIIGLAEAIAIGSPQGIVAGMLAVKDAA